jgi:DNA-binding transcriptional regulator YiaG
LETYLLINQARDSAERELTGVLALIWFRRLGHRPRPVGSIVYDDRRWFHLRQGIASPTLNSEMGMGVQFAEVMRVLLRVDELDEQQPRYGPWPARDGFDLLGVARDGSPGDIRAVYRRLWEGLRRESTVVRRQLLPAQRTELLALLEERFLVVQTELNETRTPAAAESSLAPSAPHPGEEIVRLRQQQQISQRELSLRTKIGARELDAMERFDVEALPRAVYLRGYLQEIAHVLGVDALPLTASYLTALEERRRRPTPRAR